MALTGADIQAWRGNEGLVPLLRPIGQLRPHPRNPRRGATAELRASLQRFGQQRPVLALPDGTLVAGHHVWRAAREEGWAEIAVSECDLDGPEIEAYLLADNRLSDLGLYDDGALTELLRPLLEDGRLAGTGFTSEQAAALAEQFDAALELVRAERAPSPAELPAAQGTATVFRLILTYDAARYGRLLNRLERLAHEHGLPSHSAVVARLAGAG